MPSCTSSHLVRRQRFSPIWFVVASALLALAASSKRKKEFCRFLTIILGHYHQ